MALSEKKKAQVMKDAAPVLMEAEVVVDFTTGNAEVTRMGKKTRRGATLILTDRRIIIFSKKLGGYDAQDYAYGLLTGVDHKKGFSSGHINLRAAGDSANISQVVKEDVERIAQVIRDRMAFAHRPVPSALPEPSATASVADELIKLANLRDSGVLTVEEFEMQKARLLG
jgi:hypothetical protein